MNALFFLAPLAAVILLMLPLVSVYRGTVTKKKAKHAVLFNLCGFFRSLPDFGAAAGGRAGVRCRRGGSRLR